MDPATQSLSIFLLKKIKRNFNDYLDTNKGVKNYQLKKSYDFSGALYVAEQQTAPPRWLDFIESGVVSSVGHLTNRSTSAVLFIKQSGKVFAVTFGYGRSLLDEQEIVRSFGLRVVLNAVETDSISSLDSKIVQELTMQRTTQLSSGSQLAAFGLDKEEDLIRSVSGIPSDLKFSNVLHGADGLKIRLPIEFNELGAKCKEILKYYNSKSYLSKGFDFVDHVRILNDPALIDTLDLEITNKLAKKDSQGIHMAPPSVINWEDVDGFSYTERARPSANMQIEVFLQQARKLEKLEPQGLKSRRVFVHYSATPKPIRRWRVYDVLVAEVEHNKKNYVLSGGDWFEIDASFVGKVNSRVSSIKNCSLKLPDMKSSQTEQAYNNDAAVRGKIFCADRKCIQLNGSSIEFCDLFTIDRQIIHVKKWTASSTLSHLFAQARVSAEAFAHDPEFSKDAESMLQGISATASRKIPAGRPSTEQFEVVLAIAKGGKSWKKELPFFSKLNMARAAEEIRRLGYEVRIAKISIL